MGVQIKRASEDDTERLVAYGSQFWSQTRFYAEGVDYDVATVTAMADYLRLNGVSLYAEDDGNIVGLMLIFVEPFAMNKNYLAATEYVYYVDPAYRGTKVAFTLMQQAERILKEKDVKFFSMISLTNVTPEVANRLYESLGFSQSESTFTKTLR